MKIDIREQSMMSTAHGDRIEQLMLCIMDSHSIILHTLAHKDDPDVKRLREVNDRICEIIRRLYGPQASRMQ